MMNNDVLRSVRYMLNLNNDHLLKIHGAGGDDRPSPAVGELRQKEGEEGYQPC